MAEKLFGCRRRRPLGVVQPVSCDLAEGGGQRSPRRVCSAALRRWLLPVLLIVIGTAGCRPGPKIVPVSGKVTYNGKALKFGSVMFQPESGPLARGTIQPNGTFQLTTYKDGDGCAVGTSKVRITCFQSQNAGNVASQAEAGEVAAGGLLIPKRYTSFGTSGITAEVRHGGKPFVFDLKDP